MREIVLIRHGRPALSRNVRLTSRDYAAWWKRYDTVGLWEGQSVPARVVEFVQGADRVASSTLPRAIASAALAKAQVGVAQVGAAQSQDLQLVEMIEAPLPPPNLGPLRFRPLTWGTISRILWMMGRCANEESAGEARLRARRAAQRLVELSEEGRTVVFAHGWFNRMVGTQLRREGWTCADGNGDSYWSYRVFQPPAAEAVRATRPRNKAPMGSADTNASVATASRVSEA